MISHSSIKKELNIGRVPIEKIDKRSYWIDAGDQYGYKFLDKDIGYINAANLGLGDFEIIEKEFQNAKGIIIDLRCYPSLFMPFIFGDWLKSKSTPFVKTVVNNLNKPGTMIEYGVVSNGSFNPENYKGKVILLVNSNTISQAEYTAMALSTAKGAITLGSTTAGADGDVSEITLPGGIKTLISGVAIYYPNGSETQRKGIKVDIKISETVQGIQNQQDEILEAAIKLIKNNSL